METQEKINERIDSLEKALAIKNRELEIEAALEKVRAIALSMKDPADMLEICSIISKELDKLGLKEIRNVQTAIFYESKGTYINYEYYARHDKTIITETSYTNHKIHQAFADQMLKGTGEFFSTHIDKAELPDWIAYQKTTNVFIDTYLEKASSLNYYWYSLGPVALGISTYVPLKENEIDLFKRFRNVFELAYRRFLDIETAISQAREAKIEAALERVRAKAMMMQKSDDLGNAIATVFEELDKLDMGTLRCGISVINKEKHTTNIWSTTKFEKDLAVQVTGDESMDIHPLLQGAYNAWLKQEDFSYILKGEDLNKFYTALAATNFKLPGLEITQKEQQQYLYVAHFPAGGLYAFRETPFTEETKNLIKRFAHVFNLTYTRFNDLQIAEAQAREAQIEAALERVRSRSIGMQKSEELREVIKLVYEQFIQLKILVEHAGFIIDYKEHDNMHIWLADKHEVPFQVTIPYFNCAHWNSFIEAKKNGKDFFANHLSFEEKNKFYSDLFKLIPGVADEAKEYYLNCPGLAISTVLLENMGLYIENFAGIPYSDEENKILMRFGKVFQQTYTRFLDLQKAEAQAREAQIETALERVRSRTMAMHKSEELLEVIIVIADQLKQLKLKFDNVSFGLNSNAYDFEFWSATPGQSYPEKMHIPYFDHPMMNRVRETKEGGLDFLADIFTYEEKNNWLQHLFRNTIVKDIAEERKKYMLDSIGFARSVFFMKQIALVIGNYDAMPYSDEENTIFKRFAKAFDQTYTRFLDLEKAEAMALKAEQDLVEIKAARKKAEDALAELKAAQTQLIQSEKMASLGELTAGIAHEIQNPLNFVNNFSDVSSELLNEMKEELDKGEVDEAKAIADDVKQNLEKILHHGKRADAIVKGMLQHSRTSTGKKEPTDINALCDEYLRLAYHGLRAKDKTFNATFKTDFDTSIEKINIIQQDVGRVILNLINNAFYAVNEKKNQQQGNYEPTIYVNTKKENDNIVISVCDNGTGIPQKVVDKIFQPFFTTKPTGQGTGLGLSLSYDIIKAHGGKIKVETREGEGAAFIIQLPV